ncbi:hypothetical protein [Bathymodiolus thermophilus thioautotrophic gill symbiont]|uniref:hypothetical protein n=1 Tax=Bathymodiolus thermophilus thioautotrophic gill symbiont TaxID=2360 RepID=UPI0013010FAA|nr:hypothetical protein [Bathymodiolus thermophilus thioautotrophic gill symbiont]
MSAIKEQSKRIMDNMPKDVIFDKMIKNGIRDSKAKNSVSNEEMRQKNQQW